MSLDPKHSHYMGDRGVGITPNVRGQSIITIFL
jgi:hypothetical protein